MGEIATIIGLLKQHGILLVSCVILGAGWWRDRQKLDSRIDKIQDERIKEAREAIPALLNSAAATTSLQKVIESFMAELRARR